MLSKLYILFSELKRMFAGVNVSRKVTHFTLSPQAALYFLLFKILINLDDALHYLTVLEAPLVSWFINFSESSWK